ncbi:50S ribosomal protein L21 [Balneolaceae bacterium ANBcel3]|nr:50S ribosomal protein L21 [Balneolaceae bacterium ANBcel3]
MYAIVEISGHQYKVAENDVIYVDKQKADAENKITLERVLLTSDGNGKVKIGTPTLEKAKIEAKVVDHVKGDKIVVFKKKRRKGYQVTRGHRRHLTRLLIEKITA